MFQIILLCANDDVEKLLSKGKDLFSFAILRVGNLKKALVVDISTLSS